MITQPSCGKCGASEWERRERHDNTTFFYRWDGSVWQSSDLDAKHVETRFVCLGCGTELGSGEDWSTMYDQPCSD